MPPGRQSWRGSRCRASCATDSYSCSSAHASNWPPSSRCARVRGGGPPRSSSPRPCRPARPWQRRVRSRCPRLAARDRSGISGRRMAIQRSGRRSSHGDDSSTRGHFPGVDVQIRLVEAVEARRARRRRAGKGFREVAERGVVGRQLHRHRHLDHRADIGDEIDVVRLDLRARPGRVGGDFVHVQLDRRRATVGKKPRRSESSCPTTWR